MPFHGSQEFLEASSIAQVMRIQRPSAIRAVAYPGIIPASVYSAHVTSVDLLATAGSVFPGDEEPPSEASHLIIFTLGGSEPNAVP
jgi:hypothetical protein